MAVRVTRQSTRFAQWMPISMKGNCSAHKAPSPAARAASVRLTPCVLVWFSLGPRPPIKSSICKVSTSQGPTDLETTSALP